LAILSSCTNHRWIKTFREGSYTVKANYVDSERNGPTWLYDSLGKLMRIANYKDGVLNGTTTHYYPNGIVADSVEYKCGKEYGYLENTIRMGACMRSVIGILACNSGRTFGIKKMIC
jgi:antitoxin component YwqK of YwqJK toxin-antitoxin module